MELSEGKNDVKQNVFQIKYKHNIKCNFLLTFRPHIDFAYSKSAPCTRDKNTQDCHEVLAIP
jgi:hypothetical protein